MESFTIKSLTVLAVLCQYITIVSSCVLLLNGWTPVSVKERTNLAEIVISGKVAKAFKDSRTSSQTYSAQVEILEVYKGRSLLSDLSPGRAFNISNFGDKPACYAEVFQGTDYIFFLTLFEGRLSAKYDDIFGATADFIPENVDEVLEAQGWDSWSPWSACSESCEGGQKNRQRSCRRETEGCEGEDIQTLACNLFTCRGAADLLKAFGAEKLPRGVERVGSRDGVYRIGQAARLSAPTRSVFPSAFPADFSILITANLAADFSGYVFTVTDSQQKVRLGVHYADGAWRFEYSDQDGLPGVASPVFEDLYPTDGQWHQLAFRVQGQDITMFWDCEDGVRRSLLRTRWPRIPVNSVLALGSYLTQNGSPFKGQLEQLVISEDPRVAALQCGRSAGSGKDSEQNDSDEMTTVASTSRGFQWTDWSPCSVSCGVGLQTRSLFCRDNQVEASGCVPRHIPRYQARRCRKQQCPGNCRQPCLNGGSCDVFGRCLCGVGYTGEQCEKAVCDPPCRNGGYCISPGQCACPYGYLEPDCSPFCQSQCLNGGSCVGPDVCLCPPGFAGDKCEKAVCEDGCMNGGKCVGPNKCTCRHGYTGPRCENAECYPACQNGGVCEKPYQCSCKSGTIGWFCEHFMCTKRCQNGGVCVGPNKCSCPAAFRGARCHKRACRGGCLNGGRCVRKRKCQCPLGFRGKRCQKRTCRVEGRLEPFTKKYLRAVTEHVGTPCGPWRLQICLQTRIKHVTVSRVVFRAVFRCV